MDYREAMLTLKCNPVNKSKTISRWYDLDDVNQDTLISLWESGFSEVSKGILLRRRKQCYLDKIKWGMREKRKDCQSKEVVDIDLVDFCEVDILWKSKMNSGRIDLCKLIAEFNKSINDAEVKSFFVNMVDPTEEILSLWEERSVSNRTKNLDYIPPSNLLQLMGMSKKKYLRYRKKLIDFLKENLED